MLFSRRIRWGSQRCRSSPQSGSATLRSGHLRRKCSECTHMFYSHSALAATHQCHCSKPSLSAPYATNRLSPQAPHECCRASIGTSLTQTVTDVASRVLPCNDISACNCDRCMRCQHVPLGAAKVRTLCCRVHAARLIAASASRAGRWWRTCRSSGARCRSLQQAPPDGSTTESARRCARWDQTCTVAPQSWLFLLQRDLLPRIQAAH